MPQLIEHAPPRIALSPEERAWWQRRKSGHLPRSPIWSEWVPRHEWLSMGLPGIIGASGMLGGVRMTPAELTTAVLALGGSELLEWYLAENAAQFVTLGTGVATWIGQKSAINATEAVGTQQPTIEGSAGPGGRGRLNFTAASSQKLRTATSFSVTGGERMGLFALVQPKGTGVSNQRHVALGTASAVRVAMRRASTSPTGWISDITGNPGTSAISVGADNNTNPHLHEVWCSNPHSGVLDGTSATSANTAGHLGASCLLGVGASLAASPAQFLDGYVSCVGVVKMAGTSVPSWMPAMRALLGSYYNLDLT